VNRRRHLTAFGTRRLERAFETGRILPFLIVTIAVIVVCFGFLMWIVDREDFPTLGLAMWWAASTVTTVGYGDAVPIQAAGRFVATGLMITGFAGLSLLTGVIASMLVSRSAATQAHETLDRLEAKLDEIEQAVKAK
jgi:voltage-gated potassium channel